MNETPAVISLCDRTGQMVVPWIAAGYDAVIVDLQHPAGVTREGRLTRIGADVRTWLPPLEVARRCVAAFAFPPCTDLANSGNRWKAEKGLQGLLNGLETVEACRRLLDWLGVRWCLENPVGSLSTYWRTPDYTFQPWHYLDPESKRTCLWVGEGFVMPEFEELVRPADVKESCWKMPPSAERGDLRSVTQPGFADAVFRANEPRVRCESCDGDGFGPPGQDNCARCGGGGTIGWRERHELETGRARVVFPADGAPPARRGEW